MSSQGTARLLIALLILSVLLLTLMLVLGRVLAWSAPPAPPPPSQPPDRVKPYHDLAADQPVIFFEEETQLLAVYPNGDILHRGRKVTTEREIVQALQEIVRLSPCKHNSRGRIF